MLTSFKKTNLLISDNEDISKPVRILAPLMPLYQTIFDTQIPRNINNRNIIWYLVDRH